jgi:hypothetical protein
LIVLSTALALVPRRDRISVRSRSRIRLMAALLGLISSLPWYSHHRAHQHIAAPEPPQLALWG